MATATSDVRSIGTVKVMADGSVKMQPTKRTFKVFADAMTTAQKLAAVPGLKDKADAAAAANAALLAEFSL